MAILLYGVIASNGLKVLIENKWTSDKHEISLSKVHVSPWTWCSSAQLGPVTLSGTALCAIAGIVLNFNLPRKTEDKIIKTLANNKGVRRHLRGVFL